MAEIEIEMINIWDFSNGPCLYVAGRKRTQGNPYLHLKPSQMSIIEMLERSRLATPGANSATTGNIGNLARTGGRIGK